MLRADELAGTDDKGILTVRPDAVPCTIQAAIVSTDGDEVRLRVRFAAAVVPAPAEQRLFRQTFLTPGKKSVTAADVADAWAPKVRDTLADPAAPQATDAWLAADSSALARVTKALGAAAYLAGMTLDGPVRLEAESPAYQLRKADERRRRERDEAEARRADAARRAAEVLTEIREKGVSASDVLRRAGPDEGQSLLLAALGDESTASARIVCVAGNALVEVRAARSAGQTTWTPTLRPLPPDLGPLRSVFADGDLLLVGARDGVYAIDGDAGPVVPHRDAPMPADHGFSVVARAGRHLYACHRQRGLVAWELGRSDAPTLTLRDPSAKPSPPPLTPPPLPGTTATLQHTQRLALGSPALPGAVSAILPWHDGVLIAGDRLELLRPDGTRTPLGHLPSRCVLLCESEGVVVAVCEDGLLRLFDPLDLRPDGELRVTDDAAPQGAVQILSAAVMPWSGGSRILCATQGSVVSVSPRDPVTLRYASAHRALREVAGGRGVVAAVSPDRMRLVLWDAWEPRRPAAEIHIAALTQSRIADVAVL